jgi:hypothetical protein
MTNLRPKLAAIAKAAPPTAALIRAPVPFDPHEKALLPLAERELPDRLRFVLLDVRDLVVLGMVFLLSDLPQQPTGPVARSATWRVFGQLSRGKP